MKQRLGWPGWWRNGELFDNSGELPVHLYPMGVTIDGRGPCDPPDPDFHHYACWCHFPDCVGLVDEFGFPAPQFGDSIQRGIEAIVEQIRRAPPGTISAYINPLGNVDNDEA